MGSLAILSDPLNWLVNTKFYSRQFLCINIAQEKSGKEFYKNREREEIFSMVTKPGVIAQ